MTAQEINVDQGSDTWLSLRREKIGSSDASAIMGESKWKSPYQLWNEKLDPTFSQQENDAMRRGKMLEPIAREQFCKQLGIELIPKVFIRDFQIASLDGISKNNDVVVEIKCPVNPDMQYSANGEIPPYYYAQVQHQMIVLDIKEIHYFSYHHNHSSAIIVRRDDDYCEKLLDKEKEFWQYLRNLESPPLCDKDYTEMNSIEWHEKSNEWKRISHQLKLFEELEQKTRKQLIEMANGRNCKGAGIKISLSTRKGNVDYATIPDLRNVDLEKYRKPKSVVWRLGEI